MADETGAAIVMPPWTPGTPDTIDAVFERAIEAFPDAPFLEFYGEVISYSEFDERVRLIAAGLKGLGVTPGARVASVLDNSPDALATWMATVVVGGIYVPINTAYKATFLTHQLNDSGAAVLVIDGDYADRVGEIRSELGNIKTIVVRGAATETSHDAVPFESLFEHGVLKRFAENAASSVASIIYTGGTTGMSKGCMLSHNMICNLGRFGQMMVQPAETWWTALPLFHANAAVTTLSVMGSGATVSLARRFSVSNFWRDIERSGASIASLLGPMAVFLARAKDSPEMVRCRGQLRRVIAAPMPLEAQTVFRERFGVQEVSGASGYGSTEAMPLSFALPTSDPESSGTISPFFDVVIIDDDDNPVAEGAVGEIACRPKMPHIMFEGYWANPEATQAATRNLWYHTGDLGRIKGGDLFFVDRKQDYLRRRGENISSIEVEMVLAEHPHVAEVAAYGVTADVGEEDVQVTVVLQPGAQLSPGELCTWAESRLPYFAVPRFVEVREELPKSSVGRVIKHELRTGASDRPRWDREASDLVIERR